MSYLSRMEIPAGLSALRRQQARWVCAGTLAAASTLYVASPFFTLWSITSAIRSHDMGSLNTCLKWESVRSGLKNQVVDSLIGPPHADDELPEFGASFASSAVSNAIDEEVRPDRLGVLVDHLMPPAAQSGTHQGLYGMLRGVHMHFTHPGVFEASMLVPGHENETPLRLQMRIHAFQWKIHHIDLPAPRPHPLIEASAGPLPQPVTQP
ncbi:DUF2939 domain-containing protein [Komagataeibacter rhaeticus]|uniref:DUF2939 domain-containing protein n=1 Tax=Komagataeibacter rhaeticus TaxID=215221 RepID=A0A181CE73_9PROT|nr:DUF2939 domain-containing protein [Komagataeibacter rhaeticus]ATU74057.1 DUF2939 domain-containing protein [Komagataeibacter xylinus]QIP36499.1 DUF2939 domain-containing protein [Komagataeibacter rhaeticus]QOC46270.1 DUF2939 domain-containing protein [Komagataeibacter rhaeticus]WPP21073.1 DUF2939 domain-containing protein [Komagataeibacter rhaeticus]SAY49864.1 hypothetical protein KRIGEM_02849 [Komagataeibacter rhaeticus]